MTDIKAIIVGEYGLCSESLVGRLNKEKIEIFVITGNKFKNGKKHNGVIEEYYFEYDNENIQYILESIKSDVVIFTGAVDPNFTWSKQRDSVAYLAGLNNLLISAENAGIKRFIYLSSTNVYGEVQSGFIHENSPVNPRDLRAKTIKIGEDVSLAFNKEQGMEVVVLRCSEVYGFYNNKINPHSYCTNLCLKLLQDEMFYLDAHQKHDCIHVLDVVEVVYNTITKKTIPHTLYNICSGNGVTEDQMLNMINQSLKKEHEVKFIKDSIISEAQFTNELAVKELDFFVKSSFEERFKQMIDELIEYEILESKKKMGGFFFGGLRRNIQSILGWFFPYLETIITFLLVHFFVLFTSRSSYMDGIDFYLLYVVFIAIIYGKGQTTTALLLSLIGKLFTAKQEISITDFVVDYNTYIWVLQLLIIGMGVGYIRDRYKQNNDDKEENIKYLEAELAEIKEINHSNIHIKKIFEDRLLNYQDSFAKIYSIVTALDDLEPDQIMFAAVGVISNIMKSDSIVIYSVDKGSSYARLTASTPNFSQGVSKSIKLDSLQEIYDDIRNHKVYMNRSLDSDNPSMAGGVYHEGVLESVIMIWSLSFENTTFYHMNLFSVLLNLIGQATHRANQYIEASQLSRYLNDTNILTQNSFEKILEIKKTGSHQQLADYTILNIETKNKTLKELNDLISPILRHHDYLGVGKNNKLYLLLTNTNESEAEFVIDRLLGKGIKIRKDVYA